MNFIHELPLMETIHSAEKMHGIDTHMVIEAFPKKDSSSNDLEETSEKDVIWYVEFKDIKKTFETFAEVRNFLLEEMVAKNNDLVVKLNDK